MTISIHDGVIIGYSVNFMESELRLDIETVTKEIVTVTFENYLAHHFDHVMAGSILFDIEEVDSNKFIMDNREQFDSHKSYAWPIDTNDLEKYIKNNNYNCYVIFASLGLSGYVFAKTLNFKRKK